MGDGLGLGQRQAAHKTGEQGQGAGGALEEQERGLGGGHALGGGAIKNDSWVSR